MSEALSKKITILNLLACISILFLHAYDVPSYSETIKGFSAIAFVEEWLSISLFGHTSVNVFFIISGFLFAYNINSQKQWWAKVKKRLCSLLIPYIFWALFGFIVLFLCSCLPFISNTMNMRVEISLSTIKKVFLDLEYNHPLWYLQNLVMYFLVSPLLVLVTRDKRISIVFLMLCVITVLCGAEIPVFMLMRFTAYVTGFILGQCFPKVLSYTNKWISISCGLLLLLESLIITYFSIPKWIDNLCYLTFPLLAWFSFPSADYKHNKLVKFFSGKTFWIYCGHGVILECFKQLFSIVAARMRNDAYIAGVTMISSYIVSPLLTAGLLCLLYLIVERISPKALNLLTGGRSKRREV